MDNIGNFSYLNDAMFLTVPQSPCIGFGVERGGKPFNIQGSSYMKSMAVFCMLYIFSRRDRDHIKHFYQLTFSFNPWQHYLQ